MAGKKKRDTAEVCVLQVSGCGGQGDLTAFAEGQKKSDKEKIFVIENRRIKPPLAEGDRFIGRIIRQGGNYRVKPIARISRAENAEEKIYGVVERRGRDFYLKPAEKNQRAEYQLFDRSKAKDGDFVAAVLSGERNHKQASVVKNYGPFSLSKAVSGLILDKYGIPHEFEHETVAELCRLPSFSVAERTDLRNIPLVTIDGEDSKDFDDAVWAEKTPLGFNLIVAIADVAFYVRPGSGLDREAYRRGNSVYLPGRTIPMLPEKLSNELCSLQPRQERACIACLMSIDTEGKLKSHSFCRAVMKSAARLTYREVQEALDGKKSSNIAPWFKMTVKPLYEAYQALAKAKCKRGALELESSEVKIKTDKNGNILSVGKEEHYTAHEIIEEFMIAANNAAALQLKKSKLPVMFRVHDRPPEEKLREFAPVCRDLHLKMPELPALRAEHFNKIMQKCSDNGYSTGICDLILRLQAQAQYSPHNIGHFGLGLKDYVHFTSPIRRYADLLIHRALIKALKLPEGGALEETASVSSFEDIGQHLCDTERRAVNAERDLTARMISSYLQPTIGQEFEVKICGLCNAGIFVGIDALGAEGLIPMRTLPDDDYVLESGNLHMCGKRRKTVFAFGSLLKARLTEASPVSGGLIFKYIDPDEGEDYYTKSGFRTAGNFFAKGKKK